MSAMQTTAHDPLPTDVALDGTLRLADWGVIRARGPDAPSFLHGQLTNDVTHLAPGQARIAGYCSAKGRLMASFVMWRSGPEEILLACSADLLAPTLKRLSMFVLRAKCKLDDASAEWPLYGVAGAAAGSGPAWAVASDAGGTTIRLPEAVIDGRVVRRALLAAPATPPAGPALDPATWSALEAASGIVRITAATAEQFVPQMVNLELIGGVDFKKGCYPGQEVVARSQYRGTLKRRGYALTGDAPMAPGQEVFAASDPEQPAGLVALAGAIAGRSVALVELKIAAAGEPLHLGSATGPALTPAALPYPLPVAEAA